LTSFCQTKELPNIVNISEVKCSNPKQRKEKLMKTKIVKSDKTSSATANDVLADEPHSDEANKGGGNKSAKPLPLPTAQESSSSNHKNYLTLLSILLVFVYHS